MAWGSCELTDDGKRLMRNRKELKWRNDLAFVRKHLVQEGYVSDAHYDDWALTEKGKAYARQLAQRAAASSGDYVHVKEAASVIEAALSPQFLELAALTKETTAKEGAAQLV